VPDWLRDVLIAVGAFVGGKTVNGISEQMREGRELRRGVDRLTLAVEAVSSDLKEIRSDINGQVAGLKTEIHDQVTGLRHEVHSHIRQQEAQLSSVEARVESTSSRIDALSSGVGLLTGPGLSPRMRAKMRLDQEMGCIQPLGEGET